MIKEKEVRVTLRKSENGKLIKEKTIFLRDKGGIPNADAALFSKILKHLGEE